ncbi:hypothetical protein COO60DRAFT_1479861 [Scenedesmus sp. NREL 46B-D3]|nr:hypothetical protein COO60DRAFT_1479861 [Scenedesmus sp. NREL 46B-D3]
MNCAQSVPRSSAALRGCSLMPVTHFKGVRTVKQQRRSLWLQPSVSIHVCSAVPSSVTQSEGSIDQQGDVVHSSNSDSNAVAADTVVQQETHSWEQDSSSRAAEEEWQGTKPFTLKDVDWGLTGLLGIILLLSFGAYRVLNHFRVYQHNQAPAAPQIHTVVDRQPAAPSSSSAAPGPPPAKPKGSKSKSKQDKASRSSTEKTAAAAAAAAASPDAAAAAGGSDGLSTAAGSSSAPSPAAAALNPLSEVGVGGLPGFELPAGAPGAPQPSPLDADFSSIMPAPWLGGVSQLDLPPLQLQEPLTQPPELPSIQASVVRDMAPAVGSGLCLLVHKVVFGMCVCACVCGGGTQKGCTCLQPASVRPVDFMSAAGTATCRELAVALVTRKMRYFNVMQLPESCSLQRPVQSRAQYSLSAATHCHVICWHWVTG